MYKCLASAAVRSTPGQIMPLKHLCADQLVVWIGESCIPGVVTDTDKQ